MVKNKPEEKKRVDCDDNNEIDSFTHRLHHEQFEKIDWAYFNASIEKQKAKDIRFEDLKTKIVGGLVVAAVISACGGVLWSVGEWVKHLSNRSV